MADLVITAASVKPSARATRKQGTAGATITQGQILYLDSTTKKLGLADSNGTGDTLVVEGIALNAASLDQPVSYATLDPDLVLGATLVPGTTYVLSGTPGGIATAADAVSGDEAVVLGNAKSATVLNFAPLTGGVKP